MKGKTLYIKTTPIEDSGLADALKNVQGLVNDTKVPMCYRHSNADVYLITPNKSAELLGRYTGRMDLPVEELLQRIGASK
jgi:hypothetical protein